MHHQIPPAPFILAGGKKRHPTEEISLKMTLAKLERTPKSLRNPLQSLRSGQSDLESDDDASNESWIEESSDSEGSYSRHAARSFLYLAHSFTKLTRIL